MRRASDTLKLKNVPAYSIELLKIYWPLEDQNSEQAWTMFIKTKNSVLLHPITLQKISN